MQVSKVLVVDGDRAARDALVTCLQFVGVDAHGADCAGSASSWLSRGPADVIVLSDEVEGGLEQFMRRCAAALSGAESAPAAILILTRGASAIRIPADYRVDDMLHRPVAVSRVVERVESLIDQRRMAHARLTFGPLSLDAAAGRVEVGERALTLGPTELRLLAFFMGAPERVFSRAQLLRRLWPSGVLVEERTVDVHIRRLRASLEELGCPGFIQTVRGTGYRFSSQVDLPRR